jgi:sugar fermentation stimulation protein A
MKTCYEPGWRAWISPATNPERKLRWTLELTSPNQNDFIIVNTAVANRLAHDALTKKHLAPFKDYQTVEPEQSILDSRFDFKLSGPGLTDFWVEVKNVTLMEKPGVVSFPDAVSTRGQKHLHDLIQLKKQGLRSAMLYVVSRSDAETFTPADHIDPTYAEALRLAKAAGVEVYAYRVERLGQIYELKTVLKIEGLP